MLKKCSNVPNEQVCKKRAIRQKYLNDNQLFFATCGVKIYQATEKLQLIYKSMCKHKNKEKYSCNNK